MRENEFRSFLEKSNQIKSKEKAVNSRVSKAYAAENILHGESLDYIVTDDDRMYEALICISTSPRERNGNIQNAVRWYYRFVRGKVFPTLISYKRTRGKSGYKATKLNNYEYEQVDIDLQ